MTVITDQTPNPATEFWGYLLEEDNALKNLLSGLTVLDGKGRPIPVKVWFRWPEFEEQARQFPYITIRFLSANVAHNREHRGWVQVGYKYLQDVPFPGGEAPFMEYPIPMDLHYEVTTHARINQHHAQLIGQLSSGPLHPRFAQMVCSAGTVRRVQVDYSVDSSGIEDLGDGKRRYFRQLYRLTIPTEIETAVLTGAWVSEVNISVVDTGSALKDTIVEGYPDITVGSASSVVQIVSPAGIADDIEPMYVGPLFPSSLAVVSPPGSTT